MSNSLAKLSLLVCLVCFVVSFLLTAGVLHGMNYHPWVQAGFVALVLALLFDHAP